MNDSSSSSQANLDMPEASRAETAAGIDLASKDGSRSQCAAVPRPEVSHQRSWWFLSPTATNFWLDVILFLLFVSQFWIALLLRFVFPPGPASEGWKLWSYSYEAWSRLEFAVTGALACAVVLHLMLHWNWICSVVIKWVRRGKPKRPIVKDDPTRTIWGVILLIALLGAMGISLGVAKAMIVSPY